MDVSRRQDCPRSVSGPKSAPQASNASVVGSLNETPFAIIAT